MGSTVHALLMIWEENRLAADSCVGLSYELEGARASTGL